MKDLIGRIILKMHMKETRSKTMDWNSPVHYKVQCQDVRNAGVNLPLIVGTFLIT